MYAVFGFTLVGCTSDDCLVLKLSEALKGKFVLDASWSNRNVNIGGGPMVDLETIDLPTAHYWFKAGKLPMLKLDKKAESEIEK